MRPTRPCKYCNGTGRTGVGRAEEGNAAILELLRLNPGGLSCLEIARRMGSSSQFVRYGLEKLRESGRANWEYSPTGMTWKAVEPPEKEGADL